jgi:hypothetical protein
VGINGEFRKVELTSLDPSVSAVQWEESEGHVEYFNAPNTPMTDIDNYSSVIQAWHNLTPPVAPPETLEESRVAQKALINSARDMQEADGFEYLGKILDSDERSALRITMAAMTAQLSVTASQPFSIDWTCKDNTILTLDGQQTLEMPKALAINGLVLHGKAKYLKSLIDTAETIEAVRAITW